LLGFGLRSTTPARAPSRLAFVIIALSYSATPNSTDAEDDQQQ
jgi:hypothetical protein